MKIEVVSRPLFNLPLPIETVELLMRMSSLHYDGRCKSASAVGGFIYGWKNSVTFMPDVPVSATWHELDTMLKICENTMALDERTGARETIYKLTKDVRLAVDVWNRASKDWRVIAESGYTPV